MERKGEWEGKRKEAGAKFNGGKGFAPIHIMKSRRLCGYACNNGTILLLYFTTLTKERK